MTAPGSDAGAAQSAGGVSGTEPGDHEREHGPAGRAPGGPPAGPAAAPAAPAVPPLLPDPSREDTDAAWGEYPESAEDRLYQDRPPHWDNS
jgi:hypothetical protein